MIVVPFYNTLMALMKSPILQVLYESKANLDKDFLLNDIHKGMLKDGNKKNTGLYISNINFKEYCIKIL